MRKGNGLLRDKEFDDPYMLGKTGDDDRFVINPATGQPIVPDRHLNKVAMQALLTQQKEEELVWKVELQKTTKIRRFDEIQLQSIMQRNMVEELYN